MKIDLNEVEKSGYTLVDVLILVDLARKSLGLKQLYDRKEERDYIALIDNGNLEVTPDGLAVTKKEAYKLNKMIILDKVIKSKEEVGDFDEFWKTFPVSDAHGQWTRTRTLKSNRVSCRNLYEKALKNGIKHSDILSALKWEVSDRRKKSSTSNRMSYMKNSSTWLYQKEYEVISETRKSEHSEIDDDKDWTQSIV
jgi:hypothetical protein